MYKPKEISRWDLPSTTIVPDGYDMRTVPEATKENMELMVREHNNLVSVVNMLLERLAIHLPEDES
jgi:hypothetical protein